MTAHAEEMIERYFEGRVDSTSERDALFGHLDRCQSCRAHFDELASAHRLLADETSMIPSTELALIGASVIPSEAPKAKRSWFARFGGVVAPAALGILMISLLPPAEHGTDDGELNVKGGAATFSPQLEVLCYDEHAQVVASLKKSGACPAPGFLKVIYASPRTVDSMTVAALCENEVRFLTEVKRPEPKSVFAKHAKIAPKEKIRIVAAEKRFDMDAARSMTPIMVIEGTNR